MTCTSVFVFSLLVSKHEHYDKYYRSFAPFVMTLSGAVSQASVKALMRVMRAVARADHSILDWEPARWMDDTVMTNGPNDRKLREGGSSLDRQNHSHDSLTA